MQPTSRIALWLALLCSCTGDPCSSPQLGECVEWGSIAEAVFPIGMPRDVALGTAEQHGWRCEEFIAVLRCETLYHRNPIWRLQGPTLWELYLNFDAEGRLQTTGISTFIPPGL